MRKNQYLDDYLERNAAFGYGRGDSPDAYFFDVLCLHRHDVESRVRETAALIAALECDPTVESGPSALGGIAYYRKQATQQAPETNDEEETG